MLARAHMFMWAVFTTYWSMYVLPLALYFYTKCVVLALRVSTDASTTTAVHGPSPAYSFWEASESLSLAFSGSVDGRRLISRS